MKEMSKDLRHSARNKFIVQVVFGTAFTFLTSGALLSGFAIYLGANDLLVSYISIITNICGISILLFASLIERFKSFRKLAVALTLVSKIAMLIIVAIPLAVPKNARIAVFVPMIIIAFTLLAQTTVVINNWLVTFVDKNNSGKYISKRQTFVLAMTAAFSVGGGYLLDVVEGAYIGFVLLFAIAAVMGVAEIVTIARIPDAIQVKTENCCRRFRDNFLVPIKHKPFMRYVLYIFSVYLVFSMADSFTMVYMMRYLELPFTATTLLQMIISLPQLFLLGIWGRISDKRGHAFTLRLSVWFFVGEAAFMALTDVKSIYVFIPIGYVLAAIANAGFTVSLFNRRYELIPLEGRILYDNFYTAAVGLAFILGPFLGGAIKGALEKIEWLEGVIHFGSIRILYALAAIGVVAVQLVAVFSQKKSRQM